LSRVFVFPEKNEYCIKLTGHFVSFLKRELPKKRYLSILLSGGRTPKGFYSRVSRERLPWEKIFFFFGDERCATPQSNYRMAREALFRRARIPRRNIFRIQGELPPALAASEYEKTLRDFFKLKRGAFPSFDLVLLGLGSDGHTASLFPGAPALKERHRLVVPVIEKSADPPERITVTLPVINHAKNVWFLVTGRKKRDILRKVLKRGSRLPAGLVRPRPGRLIWFVDDDAAVPGTAPRQRRGAVPGQKKAPVPGKLPPLQYTPNKRIWQ
jgi:6-phosphogluconolactonase